MAKNKKKNNSISGIIFLLIFGIGIFSSIAENAGVAFLIPIFVIGVVFFSIYTAIKEAVGKITPEQKAELKSLFQEKKAGNISNQEFTNRIKSITQANKFNNKNMNDAKHQQKSKYYPPPPVQPVIDEDDRVGLKLIGPLIIIAIGGIALYFYYNPQLIESFLNL
ncbi:hypothetical protein GF376_00055 [Candidatus Peregrinibacteria bacterium]|nr:hypothetical protein [Candidatus Peregrinibacteria bacterium]